MNTLEKRLEKREYDISYRERRKLNPDLLARRRLSYKKYNIKNKEKKKEYLRMYAEKNKEKLKDKDRVYNQSPIGRFKSYINRSKYGSKTKLEFNISFDQFLTFWKKDCHYCGIPVETIGLDRINNSVGYIMSNLVSCCRDCNWMKKDFTQQEFLQHIRLIAFHTLAS